MPDFHYEEIYQLGEDTTSYRLLTKDYVRTTRWGEQEFTIIEAEALELLSREAFKDIAHLFRSRHLQQLSNIVQDPEASDNDVFVAVNLLENAIIAAEKKFPSCQDTGTAICIGKKGQFAITRGKDKESLSRGVFRTYTETALRYSQAAPFDMYKEVNTGTNLPAQIDLYACDGDEYHFLFVAKGGGSANKSFLYQETKAILNPTALREFLDKKLRTLGTAACPPYHLALVVGGTSAEENLKIVKLASTGYLDELPTTGNAHGRAFRDPETEQMVLELSRGLGIGAQFGGKYFAHDVRVIRLPRHGASCPVGLGVSCSADRNIKGKITKDGVFLEQLDTNPAQYLPPTISRKGTAKVVRLDLDAGMDVVRAELSKCPIKTRVMLSGKMIVARDNAHAKLYERLQAGEPLPGYFKDHVIYYAGPAKTPEGYASGSFGPTTAGRMDSYIPIFQAQGASLVTLAKGNRSASVTESCKQHGGFYLGSIGGAAAILGRDNILSQEIIAYPELGMEAIFLITVKDFPAFIVVDDKGNDFFKGLI